MGKDARVGLVKLSKASHRNESNTNFQWIYDKDNIKMVAFCCCAGACRFNVTTSRK